ncbi:hypothetical protein JCM10914A_40460 [Paenibacillus sp. JCM 10914]|uniref:hypothetical protein n=1 Tax=Paenibacillus sp. JCM 10914 TaxID=1236974 RepID=UPI0003CCA1C7|nr:hypothetical protein [Paenibacillus sp. JCM 10914]GAE05259.1 hypothetical protein JCM10914_1354 [Paenibacillus sp. JCM 10914]
MNETNTIYVMLTDTGTKFTKMIKRITAAPYNHASLALDEGLNEVYSFGRKCANNPWVGGFVQEDIYEGTYRHFPDTRCALLRMEVSRHHVEAAGRVIQHYKDEKDAYSYNLLGMIGLMVRLDITRERSYFCSQFVAEAIKQSGISLWDRPSSIVTPNDFLEHPSLELVYEGMLYDYPLLDQTRLANQPNLMQTVVL